MMLWVNERKGEMSMGIRNVLQGVLKHLFPSPQDDAGGGACHEAAFDPDQFPESMRQRLKNSGPEAAPENPDSSTNKQG
jgi:hypothetical protein